MQQTAPQQSIGSWIQTTDVRIWLIALILVTVVVLITLLNRPPDDVFCSLFDDYATTRNETHRVLMALGSKGLNDYRLQDGQIHVSEKKKAEYLAAINDQQALPQIYDTIQAEAPNPFLLRTQQQQQELNRKKKYVRNMVLRLPGVKEVLFEMDAHQSDSPFKPDRQSAALLITMQDGSVLSSQNVTTIQHIVCGSFATLKPTQIFVTDANTGISYHDLSDSQQSALIELVNWQTQRSHYYREQLQQLKTTYPGLQISVEVTSSAKEESIDEPTDKIAAAPSIEIQQPSPAQITLNSGGSVTNSASELAPPATSDPMISQASYEMPVLTDSSNLVDSSTARLTNPEIIKIEIRVPNELIADFPMEDETAASNEEKFEVLKSQIVSKIKTIIPSNLLTASPPIAIFPDLPADSTPDATAVYVANLLQTYWPVLTAMILGLIFVSLNRNPKPTQAASTPTAELTIHEEELQSQLSHLIDSDPEAAATVLKNWIRNAG